MLLFTLALLSSVFVPIYSDEVALILLKARIFNENGTLVSLLPQCKSSFVSPLPLTWYPAAVFFGIIYSHLNLIGLRLAGVGGALLWMGGITFWSFKKAPSKSERLHLVAGLVALTSFGVMPFILILARFEQVMILCLTYFCLVPLYFGFRRLPSFIARGVVFSSFLLVTSIFYFSHPKALFFTPLILASAICTVSCLNRKCLLFLTLAILLTAYQSYNHAKLLSQCEEAPIVRNVLAFTLEPSLLIKQPLIFFERSFRNLESAPSKIFHHVTFQKFYQSDWLPPAKETSGDWLAEKLSALSKAIYINWFPLLVFLLSFKIFKEIKAKDISAPTILAAALSLSLVGHAAFYNSGSWNFYTPGLMIPLLIVLVLLIWPEILGSSFSKNFFHFILAGLLIFASLNIGALLTNITPRLIKQYKSRAASIPDQWLSVPPFYFEERKTIIRTLAARCGIQGDGASRLVIDHETYFAFEQLRQPLHILYISEAGFGGDIRGSEILSFLNKMGSSGIITRCTYIPPALRNSIQKMGGYCCRSEIN